MHAEKKLFKLSMKMLFQYTDNPERELKLENVQQLRQ